MVPLGWPAGTVMLPLRGGGVEKSPGVLVTWLSE
jgi:hypothetical protein